MKLLSVFIFSFLVIFPQVSYAKALLQLGGYKSTNCEAIIFLEKNNEILSYRIRTEGDEITGSIKFLGNSIIFGALKKHPNDKPYNVMGEIVSKNRFLIQNYGNSMNVYNVFPSCEDKYLEYNMIEHYLATVKYKSILYILPDQKTNMYLIKGDKVTILDEKMDDNNQKWYFINYKGKKDINMWIKAEAVDLK
ncbi:hypothetical protein [Actinobacillus equuli]|uniref:hypothetical protein n=1 Tax=Actinobacillus equuli TaxID=718 RepID=UPI003C6EFFC9